MDLFAFLVLLPEIVDFLCVVRLLGARLTVILFGWCAGFLPATLSAFENLFSLFEASTNDRSSVLEDVVSASFLFATTAAYGFFCSSLFRSF